MLAGSQQTTKGGHLKRPETLICSWVNDACECIPSKIIHPSFLKCGINNESEDDAVYRDETKDDNSTHLTDDEEDDMYDDCALQLTREQFAAVSGNDSDTSSNKCNKMLSYRRETMLQGAL